MTGVEITVCFCDAQGHELWQLEPQRLVPGDELNVHDVAVATQVQVDGLATGFMTADMIRVKAEW